jgi:hypothetical protein
MRNDLKVVTIFMVFIFVLTTGLEVRPQDIGHVAPPAPVTPPGGNNQTQNLTTGEILSRSGYTSEGQSTPETFSLDFKQVSMVKAELLWTDDYGSNDVFKLELARDGQSLGQDQGSTGDLIVQVTAGNGENMAGNFTVTITCVNAPGVVGPSPINRDKGNSWDLTVTATHSQEGSP